MTEIKTIVKKSQALNRPRVIAIVGQTATGKSDVAVKIAKKINGEILSCDSRQVYRGMNIGTGKITKSEMMGIPHHLLDIADPKKEFSVDKFKKLADKKIKEIVDKGKIPIVVGGTGFYAEALIYGISFPNIPPNIELRNHLSKLDTIDLIDYLRNLDPERLNNIDPRNRVRIIRSIEIASAIGKVPKIKKTEPYNCIWIGITIPDTELKDKINKRLAARIKKGMVAEAKRLHEHGLSFKKMESFGLEYKYLSMYLKGLIRREQMTVELQREIWKYAKRQKTWFKRNKDITWYRPEDIEKMCTAINKFVGIA